MTYTLNESIRYFDDFLIYFAVALVLLIAFTLVYTKVTPYNEIALIREGNTAAAISLSGALLGFALPLASALRTASGLLDVAAWAFMALAAQLAAYALVALLLKDFSKRINRGEMAAAVLAAAIHLGVGLINSAAMSF